MRKKPERTKRESKEQLTSRIRPYQWKKGQSGNPGGMKKIPQELKDIKYQALNRAIVILSEIINDPVYLAGLYPSDLARFLEITFDRFGLPKVTMSQLSGPDGQPIQTERVDLSGVPPEVLQRMVNELSGSR